MGDALSCKQFRSGTENAHQEDTRENAAKTQDTG